MNYLITFLEGVITFVSPCLLPMLPIYVAYFAGGSRGAEQGQSRSQASGQLRHTLVCAVGFIVGFTVVFTLMGALAGTAGRLLLDHQGVLNAVCGIIVIALGLNYLGVLRIPLLQRTLKPKADVMPRNFGTSLLFGMVFAIGWTPCVGAFLGSALSLAASSAQTATGVALLLCYSLGLGLPFAIAAVLIDRLEGAFAWVKAHYDIINMVSGVVLVLVGILMASGMLGMWLRLLSI